MPVKGRGDNRRNVRGVKAANPPLSIRSLDEPLVAAKIVALFASARRLRADSHAGATSKALRGKNLALLLATPAGRETSPLHQAAQELGVRVAEVRFEADGSGPRELGTLARLLGRLYDAIDCGALPPSIVQRIEQETSVPVYAGLGQDDHPARALADLMTLCERGSGAGGRTTVLFVGDPQTPRSAKFLSAAREMGFAPRISDAAHPPRNGAAFAVDARAPGWLLYAQGRPIEETLRSANHRSILQSVLLETIPRT